MHVVPPSQVCHAMQKAANIDLMSSLRDIGKAKRQPDAGAFSAGGRAGEVSPIWNIEHTLLTKRCLPKALVLPCAVCAKCLGRCLPLPPSPLCAAPSPPSSLELSLREMESLAGKGQKAP